MGERLNPSDALEIIRKRQLSLKRYHKEARQANVARMRAIEGLCGQCENVTMREIITAGSRQKGVQLGCLARCSPLELYLQTPLGEIPSCLFHQQASSNPSLS